MQKNNMQENNLQQITCRIPSEGDVLRESACEDKQRAATNPNTPRAPSGPVRISVAYGNIPAPGRRKIVCVRVGCSCGMSAVALQIHKDCDKNIKKASISKNTVFAD